MRQGSGYEQIRTTEGVEAMSKYRLHGRGRKECPVYSHRYNPADDRETPKVFRPHSERQVSAVHELNRLQAKLETAEKENKRVMMETLGWAYADACVMADNGIDIRQILVPTIIERCENDFANELQKELK